MESVAAQYRNIFQYLQVFADPVEDKFLAFVESEESEIKRVKKLEAEVIHLQEQLIRSEKEIKALEMKLKSAKLMLDSERSERVCAEREKNDMAGQIGMVMELLGKGQVNETREKLQQLQSSFTNLGGYADKRRSTRDGSVAPLSTITEDHNSLGSILSISDIDMTEDDLEDSRLRSGRSFKRKSNSDGQNDSASKRRSVKSEDKNPSRKSNDEKTVHEVKTQITYYTEGDDRVKKFLTEVEVKPSAQAEVIQHGNLHAVCTPARPPLPSTPQVPHSTQSAYSPRLISNAMTPQGTNSIYGTPNNTPHTPMMRNYSASKMNARGHSFQTKTIYKAEHCQPCSKRIKFGKIALKCRDCRATCHPECRESVPLPCVPVATTPNTKGQQGSIADYTPVIPPMVPALVVHCCNEVENRGLNEVGIYRIPGSEKDVKELKERFLRGKGMPNLSQVDVHVICGTLKDFMRSLKEPLITHLLWNDFATAADKPETQDSLAALYQAISELPQPNRDTIAWVITHLQRVAECTECKMPISNLAKVFGPTLVGYSVPEPQPAVMVQETHQQQIVMARLLEISCDYWNTFLNVADENIYTGLQHANPLNCGILADLPTGNQKRRRSILSRTPLQVRDTPKSRSAWRK